MRKFTTGTWTVKRENGRYYKVESDGILIAELDSVIVDPRCATPEGVEANARLISAAPDLLEACMVAQEELIFGGDWNTAKRMIELAIKKATE